MTEATTTPRPKGFAALTPERRLEIARKGGASVPSSKRSFARNPSLAASAGRTGGQVSKRPAKAGD